MGQLVGSYMAFILMELVVALPVYYILRAILKRKNIEAIALISCIVALGAGWVAGYRFTKDVMVSEYLVSSKQNEISNYGVNLTKIKWSNLRNEFISSPENIQKFHIGAAKTSLPSVLFVAIILFWLAERQKKKNMVIGNNEKTHNEQG